MSKPFNNWPNDAGFDVMHEERKPVELQVSGTFPSYISGTLYRTGPGGCQVKSGDGKTISVDHWFDGFSQNHRFQIIQSDSSTRVIYNSRRSVDPLIENIRNTGKMGGFSFGQKRDPRDNFFKKIRNMFVPDPRPPLECSNIGVTLSVNPPGLGDIDTSGGKKRGHVRGIQSLWVKTDAAILREIEPETLEPMGIRDQRVLHPELTGKLSAAHAKSDPITGDLYNYNLTVGKQSVYRVFRVSAATGTTDILETITDAPGAYVHSTLITENYFILCVWSGHYAWHGAKILWEHNMLDAISPFDRSKKALWYVIDRRYDHGLVAKYESDPFFCFHTINAWEEPSASIHTHCSQIDIVADLSVYGSLDVIKRFYYKNIKSTSPNNASEKRSGNCDVFLRRWRLPRVNATTTSPFKAQEAAVLHTAVHDHSCDFPTINPCFLTHPSRYVYGVCDRGLSTFFDGIVKYDMRLHKPTYWSVEGHTPGEPIFIPDPDGFAEDDGVLLSVVLDGFSEKSYLLVLDAKTMQEVGRASMECAVGFGFHGVYYSEELVAHGSRRQGMGTMITMNTQGEYDIFQRHGGAVHGGG